MYWIKYLSPYKKQTIFGFLFKLLEAILELYIPLVVAQIVDKGVKMHNSNYVIHEAFILYGLALLGYISACICQYYASVASQGFGTLMRRDLFQHMNDFDYQDLDKIPAPSLVTRMTSDVNQLQLAIAMMIRLVSRSPFLIIGSIVLSFTIDIQMGCVILAISPFIAFTIFILMRKSEIIYQKIQKLLDKVSSLTYENLSGVRVIRAFCKQKEEISKFKETISIQKKAQLKAGDISGLLNPMTTIIINLGIILILYFSGLKINIGDLSQGDVIALMNYMNQILLSMYVFANVIFIFIKANTSYKRVAEVLDTSSSLQEGLLTEKGDVQTVVSFNHVTFSYDEGQALEDISFQIKKGETFGIIGGTGSGKSSIAYLIGRFYERNEGSIELLEKDVKEYTFQTLRDSIAYVNQNVVLFQGTIRSNLLWGNKYAKEDDLKRALSIAQAEEFVSRYDDYLDHSVSENGHNFSGGQRQRLTIARALVKQSDLLVLDDSASSLDYATDAKLRQALHKNKITTMIISQRVSSIKQCDHILVLDHGKQVGLGTHEDLIKTCPIYQEIVLSQGGKL